MTTVAIRASATYEDYHCDYLQDKTSGDVFAVQIPHDGSSAWATDALHHSEVRDVLAHNYDNEWDDWDETDYRVLTEQDIRDRFATD